MLQTLTMAACFENIEKANQVGFHISIRVGDGVAHTGLCRKVNDHRWLVLLKQLSNQFLISNVAFDKSKCGILGQLVQAELFQCYVIVVIHVVDADDHSRRCFLVDSLHKVGPYKARRACD